MHLLTVEDRWLLTYDTMQPQGKNKSPLQDIQHAPASLLCDLGSSSKSDTGVLLLQPTERSFIGLKYYSLLPQRTKWSHALGYYSRKTAKYMKHFHSFKATCLQLLCGTVFPCIYTHPLNVKTIREHICWLSNVSS